jgi:DNA-binding transcriptional LysR family regulator
MLPSFVKRYPNVRVVLAVDNRAVDLQIEGCDLAIRIGLLPDSELVARRLAAFEIWTCASPSYLSEHPPITSPEDLLGHRLLAHADRRDVWQFRTESGVVRDVEVDAGIVIPEPDVMKTMVIAGAGIGLIPDFHAADAVARGALVRLFPELKGRSLDAHALYPSHRSLSAKVRVFIDALAAYLGTTPVHRVDPPN